MKSRFLLFLLLLTSASSFASTTNYVIFGDSLSDTDNYPEPSDVSKPKLDNFNLYVPISNPVPSEKYGTSDQQGYLFPTQDFLQQSIGEQGEIKGQQKQLYSINWPLYFIFNKEIASGQAPALTSWYQLQKNPPGQVQSINYAWGSALAEGEAGKCYHDNGSDYPGSCTSSSIMQQRALYQEHTQDGSYDQQHGYKFDDLEIPNLATQVSLYQEDSKRFGLNKADQKSTYIIYIGGNDIAKYLKSKLSVSGISMFLTPQFDKKVPQKIKDQVDNELVKPLVASVQTQVQRLISSAGKDDKIVLMTLPSLSNLHEGYTYWHVPVVGGNINRILDYAVQSYNKG
ncbi:SGNH/GDSL hydrolase family protein [Dongshaea marina]|uniref:SGNH/GDSL hydrolase family protein n=1 Tax=Dongshaea marina TaxID=2047966 RepID=UPI000D3E6BBB|nr:SGNH/GDSL hydrolase family protein [Dongshaea marina]